MVTTQLLQEIKERFQFYRYPEPLVDAICAYLAEEGSLKAVEREWQATLMLKQPAFPELIIRGWMSRSIAYSWDTSSEGLSEFELRLISICAITGQFWGLLCAFSSSEALAQALERLHSQGIEARLLLQEIFPLLHLAIDQQGNLNALGCFLLQFLPEHFAAIFPPLPAEPPYPADYFNAQALVLIQLLLETEPPQVDLVWQVIEQVQREAEPASLNGLGRCVGLLLKTAPERFTTWARAIVSSDSSASLAWRKIALEALMEHHPARHVDLAVATARASSAPRDWRSAQLRQAALDAAYRFDPVQHLALVEEVAVTQSSWPAEHALQLLLQAPAERARPALQHCVAQGSSIIAWRALKALLSQQWEGRHEYALSLLTHHSKRIRRAASAWLAQQPGPR
jgi:hypothetical protein